jgi:hypothetical protein
MIYSNIDSEKQYMSDKNINEDFDETANVYMLEDESEIILGKMQTEDKIVYHYVYSLNGDEPNEKIGVFEITKDAYFKGDGNEINLEDGEILYFEQKSRVENEEEKEEIFNLTDEELSDGDLDDDKDLMRVTQEKKDETEEKVEVPEESKDETIFKEKEVGSIPMLSKETETDADNEKLKYKSSDKNNWMEKFTKNNNYSIHDNEGGGDCFFATLRDAYREIGKETTVDKLRKTLSDEVTDDLFEGYRNMYLFLMNEYQDTKKQMSLMEPVIRKLKKDYEAVETNKEQSAELFNQLKLQKQEYDRKKIEKKNALYLLEEFKFMENINSVEDLKNFILNSGYWADSWSISTLEKKLNVKVIILSEESYENGDVDSVMNCGHLNDSDKDELKTFKPDYYVMVSYTGNHYKLIKYKKKAMLKFTEIPYDVKSMIINKCLETNSGGYYLIPDFRNLKREMGINADTGVKEENEDAYLQKDLYNEEDAIMFYSNSANAKVGKGSNEKLGQNNISKYAFLNAMSATKKHNWRRMLDDSFLVPFTSPDKMRWNSVTHYVLGSQFKKGRPDIYAAFSAENKTTENNNISEKIEDAKKFSEENKKHIDSDFYEIGVEPRHIQERALALEAKFSQNRDFKQVLMETKDAKLIQFKRKMPAVEDELLMKLRKKYNIDDNA